MLLFRTTRIGCWAAWQIVAPHTGLFSALSPHWLSSHTRCPQYKQRFTTKFLDQSSTILIKNKWLALVLTASTEVDTENTHAQQDAQVMVRLEGMVHSILAAAERIIVARGGKGSPVGSAEVQG